MRHTFLASLLLALATTFSLSAVAAPAPAPVELSATAVAAPQVMAQLDLNTADAATLQRELKGIGKTKAEAIVAYRQANGKFTSVDELLEIKGIGKALLERNRDKVMVN